MKLVCVVGPTGCGKTWLGVELAKMLGGEVVSCDSMQIYRGMAIGTAAPTAEEMQGIPHHMVGVADPRENYSVARYADDAAKCVDDILSRGKQPVIVGGTGLYLNALLAGHGFAGGDKDGRYREELESRWDKEGGEAMFVELRRIDPETAGNLHLNDKKRILRALEVYYETGKTMAQHNAETKLIPPRYDSVRIGLAYEDRDDMKRAIDLRVDKMVEAGLFDEVRALLDSGLPRDVTAMQAIGYKEALAYLDGEAAREEAIDDQAPLPPVCQAPAHVAAARPRYPLGLLEKNEDSPRLPRFFDRNSPYLWRILTLTRTSRPQKRKERKAMKKIANLQDLFLLSARRNRTSVTVFLVNGFQMRGVITGFDSFVVILESDGKQQMLYKHAISTIVPIAAIDLKGAEESEE